MQGILKYIKWETYVAWLLLLLIIVSVSAVCGLYIFPWICEQIVKYILSLYYE